jgi:hypothetical protein
VGNRAASNTPPTIRPGYQIEACGASIARALNHHTYTHRQGRAGTRGRMLATPTDLVPKTIMKTAVDSRVRVDHHNGATGTERHGMCHHARPSDRQGRIHPRPAATYAHC